MLLGVLAGLSTAQAEGLPSDLFPVDAAMRVRVEFWKKVYTEITSSQAYLHDSEKPHWIYETIEIGAMSRRERKRFVKDRKKHYGELFRSIAKKNKENLTSEEKSLLDKVGEDVSLSELKRLAIDVRFQQGMKDRYVEGFSRSFRHLEDIRRILKAEGVPEELAFLPHVESSFNYLAYSKVGAAGIWQFMRSTGRLYGLKQGYLVDERRDPIKATHAAARLLKNDYQRLQAWPLAITAYNHGANSIVRAVETMKTRKISEIIQGYDGRRFGFASKNFYATFVAASEISLEPEKYFGRLIRHNPVEFAEMQIPKSLTIQQISKITGVNKTILQEYNLALRPSVFRTSLYLPKGFVLKVPKDDFAKLAALDTKTSAIPEPEAPEAGGGFHVVSRGETLYDIAQMYRLRISDLITLNEITNPSAIYPGMKLQVPVKGGVETASTKVAIALKESSPGSAPTSPGPAALVVKASSVPAPTRRQEAPEQPKKAGFPEGTLFALKTFVESSGVLGAKQSDVTTPVIEKPAKAPVPEPVAQEKAVVTTVSVPVAPVGGDSQAPTQGQIDLSSYNLEAKRVGPREVVIRVEVDETLGHYADWASMSTQRIRNLNHFSYNEPIRIGQKIKLNLDEKELVQFESKRVEYHSAIQEDFFGSYRVGELQSVKVRMGDTPERLVKKLNVPFWLLRKTSGGQMRLMAGDMIQVPQVVPISEGSVPAETDEQAGEQSEENI